MATGAIKHENGKIIRGNHPLERFIRVVFF